MTWCACESPSIEIEIGLEAQMESIKYLIEFLQK